MNRKSLIKILGFILIMLLPLSGCTLLKENADQLLKRGITAVGEGFPDGAIQHLSNALNITQNEIRRCEIYSYLGWAYYIKNDLKKAGDYFENASLYLKTAELYAGKLLVYASSGNFNGGASFSYVLNGIPEDWSFRVNGTSLEKKDIAEQVCICLAVEGDTVEFEKYAPYLSQQQKNKIEEVFFQ